MRTVSMSVTEASRNFADCINRARYQGTTFILHKNGVAVARIVPEKKTQAEKELETETVEAALPVEADRPPGEEPRLGRAETQREIW
jgi:antitoxin (DNA-binding transcriptional repressor) of toxin-antitoxin stability system